MPQGDLVPHLIRSRWLGVLKPMRQGVVGLDLGGHTVSIEAITLVLVAAPLAQRRLVGWHVTHVDLLSHEVLGERPAKAAGALDADPVNASDRLSQVSAAAWPTLVLSKCA